VAVSFAISGTAVGLSGNVPNLPLLGRSSDVPMLVILTDAIGGFMRADIVGLFVGAFGHDLSLAASGRRIERTQDVRGAVSDAGFPYRRQISSFSASLLLQLQLTRQRAPP
jgi:hypothetical protein